MTALVDWVKDFYSSDPIRGEDARLELLKHDAQDVIGALIPFDKCLYSFTTQAEIRLKKVAEALGPQILPHLIAVISYSDSRSARSLAPVCFAGFPDSAEARSSLLDNLKNDSKIETKRLSVEALGYLGASGWDFELKEFARFGRLQDGDIHELRDHLSQYSFEKFSSCVVEALTRFAAKSKDPSDSRRMLESLTEFVEFRQAHYTPWPNAYDLVERHAHEFTEIIVDPLISEWGRSSNEELQRLCLNILGHIAPVRATRFLLDVAISVDKSDLIRTSAAVALAEIRMSQVTDRVTVALGEKHEAQNFLDWPVSTLYAVSGDWSNFGTFVDEMSMNQNEQGAQLRYSFALKGDDRCKQYMIDLLDDPDPFHRWTSALSLARLLGPASRQFLEHRDEESGEALERCGMYAALIRAGDHSKAAKLHEELQRVPALTSLKSIWKLEILDAFRFVDTFDSRAFLLWQEAACIGQRQLQYFNAISATSLVEDSPSKVAVSTPSRHSKGFKENEKDSAGTNTVSESSAYIQLLIDGLPAIKPGKASADDYHNYVIQALEAIFSPNLKRPQKEEFINDGRKRIDITFSNNATEGFFSKIRSHPNLTALYVIIECKNYTDDPKNPEVDQLAGRLNQRRGNFGILICRKIERGSELLAKCKDFLQDNKFLLALDDHDLLQLLNFKRNNDAMAISDYMDDLFKRLLM
jgi:hypothetical protein